MQTGCPRPRSTSPTAATKRLAGILALGLLPASLALAQWRTSQDAEICVTGTGVRSLDIAVCGRALGQETLSELDRASVHTARGKAHRDSGQLTEALADFDAALTHNPYSASTFYERAIALDRSDRYERALEDFRSALALSPYFAAAYKHRAVAHFYAGNLACAHADLDAAATLVRDDPEVYAFRGFLHYMAARYREADDEFQRVKALDLPYPYLPLWLYLTGAASGDPGRGALVKARAALLPSEWPKPLLNAYLGELDAETLIATLENDDGVPDKTRRLAASHYYLAALARLDGRQELALSHLTKTLALVEHRMPERVLAEHALAGPKGERLSTSTCE